MTELGWRQCQDCENVFRSMTGDECSECGSDDVRPIPIGSPEAPIPNVGLDHVRIELAEMGKVVVVHQGEEYDVVGTKDGVELRKASEER